MHRMGMAVLVAAVASVWFAWSASAQGNSILVAAPFEGHSGDPVYITGSGFRPNQAETVIMACPDWAHAFRGQSQNFMEVPGPTTDSHGNFPTFRLPALSLQGTATSGCYIYANDGANQFGPDIPAIYTILPANAPVDHCARYICVHLSVDRRTISPGKTEVIFVKTGKYGVWPGAVADVAIRFPHSKIIHRHVRLNMHGEARITLRGGHLRPASASVKVSVRLGPFSGHASASVTLIHPRRNGQYR